MTEIKGWHVLAGFGFAFSVIISVNLALAFNAVHTFPGLEVKNSYVASQHFQARRTEQEALGWTAKSWISDGKLYLSILAENQPVAPEIESAIFGSATSVELDQTPDFRIINGLFVADVGKAPGNWNLRLKARADDGTLFDQRIVVGGHQ